jgi:hypothetical protein
MKYLLFIGIIVGFLLPSCGSKKPETEAPVINVMTEDTMKAFFVDLFLTESLIRQKEREGRNVSWFSNHYYSLMLEKYNMDTTRIVNSFQYYAERPEILKAISSKALDSLTIVEAHLQAQPN